MIVTFDLSPGNDRMSQANENAGIMDVKKNLRRLYKMIAIGIMDNKEIVRRSRAWGKW